MDDNARRRLVDLGAALAERGEPLMVASEAERFMRELQNTYRPVSHGGKPNKYTPHMGAKQAAKAAKRAAS